MLGKAALGASATAALAVVAGEPLPGLGVTEGTLYPLLSRLRVQGFISARLEESSEGPARKYYALTRAGRGVMKAMNEYLENLNQGMRKLQERNLT